MGGVGGLGLGVGGWGWGWVGWGGGVGGRVTGDTCVGKVLVASINQLAGGKKWQAKQLAGGFPGG